MSVFIDPDETGRRLADLGAIGFWECDFAAGQIRVSPQLATFYGLVCCEGQDAANLNEFIANVPPTDRTWADRWRPLGLDSSGISTVEYRVWDQSGEIRWVRCRGRYETDSAGRLIRGHGLVFDITAAKQEGKTTLCADAPTSDPIALLADLLLEAYAVAKRLPDDTIAASISVSLFKTGCLLARQEPRRDTRSSTH